MRSCKLFLLVPVHNRVQVVSRLLAQLLSQTSQEYHLVLLDDGSTDDTAEVVSNALGEKVTVVKGNGNWWWGGSLHRGFQFMQELPSDKTNGTCIGILNDDSLLEPSLFAKAIDYLDAAPNKTCLVAWQQDAVSGVKEAGASIRWFPFATNVVNSPDKVECAPTRGLFMKTRDFLSTGGFWPKRIPHYFSDYEFTYRIRNNGFRLVYTRDIVVRFLRQESGRNERRTSLLSKKCAFNPLPWTWFVWRHAEQRWLAPLIIVEMWAKAILRQSLFIVR